MFGKTSATKPQNRIDTLIGATAKIHGDICFSGGLRVDGEVHGNITSADDQPSTLVISEHAHVEGQIAVSHLVINGTVIGPIQSREFLELQAKAKVTGDVQYNTVEIHLGAVIQGRLVHEGAPAKAVELKLASSS